MLKLHNITGKDIEILDTFLCHYTNMVCLFNMFVSIVTVDPPGPLYLPISTQRNITCSVQGGTLTQFVVTFSNKNSTTYTLLPGTELVTGIVVISADLARFLISINIYDTSVTGIRCEGNLQIGSSSTPGADTLNLIIYGEWYLID